MKIYTTSFLELSGPSVCKLCGFSSYPNCSNCLTVLLNVYHFLFRHYCFYFKSYWRLSWWPSSNSYTFRSHFCSSHFFAISEFKSLTILTIFSAVSTFMLSKRVKIFVRVIRKFFRLSPKSSFSIWRLILSTICAIRSTAPSIPSPPSKIKSLVSSSSASSC